MSSERERRSDDVVIRVRNAGKCYHMYDAPVDRLKQALLRWRRTYFREFWAVRGVDLEVRRGEAVGIIGRNGGGKSTLLQMIAGTLAPSEGTAEVAGRIAALLELGSGFNPDFTGRENVFMNATILGLSRREIEERFDAIASFADIGPFLDQPVKTYSSGMLVRLAFAVQVQVEPDVLIVDEALAVGDSLFQKRCFQRLEALRSEGVTLLFVSHDQESVRTLTSRAILLHQGRVRALGTSSEVILEYRRLLHEAELAWGAAQVLPTPALAAAKPASAPLAREQPSGEQASSVQASSEQALSEQAAGTIAVARSDALSFGTLDASVQSVRLFDARGEAASTFKPGDEVRVRIACEIHRPLEHLNIGLRIRNKQGVKMYSWGTLNQDIAVWSGRASGEAFWNRSFKAGERVEVEFAFVCTLGMNFYEVQASVSQERDRYYRDQRMLHWIDEAAFFQVIIHQDDYFFGGVCDLAMTARVLSDSPALSNP